MARGGKRPGSGRPIASRTIEKERVKDYIAGRIAEHAEPLTNALLDKALAGDVMASRELFDRGFGKASQAVDVTSGGEQIGVTDPEALIEAAKIYGASIAKRKTR